MMNGAPFFTPSDCGIMVFWIDADGTVEAIGFLGADIVAVDGEIFEVVAERERRKAASLS